MKGSFPVFPALSNAGTEWMESTYTSMCVVCCSDESQDSNLYKTCSLLLLHVVLHLLSKENFVYLNVRLLKKQEVQRLLNSEPQLEVKVAEYWASLRFCNDSDIHLCICIIATGLSSRFLVAIPVYLHVSKTHWTQMWNMKVHSPGRTNIFWLFICAGAQLCVLIRKQASNCSLK